MANAEDHAEINLNTPDHDELDQDNGALDFLDDEAARQSHNGVLVYNGTSYAVGLIWLSISEDEDKSSIYKKCRSLKADFYCYRNNIFQCGFGALRDGHRVSMPSMAAIAADSLVGEWHGVFVADNGWHYIAAHSDNIAPYGDILFSNEEDAYNHFTAESKKLKWPKTYVPDTWNHDGNDGEISYESIIENTSFSSLKPANLDALFSGKVNKGMAMIAAIVVFLIIFASIFSTSFISQLMPQKAQAPFPNIAVRDTIALPPREVEAQIDPIVEVIENFSIAQPSTVLDACLTNFDEILISLPGWNLATMRCRSNIVEAVWRKGVGSLATIQPYIDQFPFGVSTILGSRDDFIVSKAINSNALTPEKMNLAKRQEVLLTLNNRFANLGRVDVQDIAPNNQNRNATGGSRRLAAMNNRRSNANEQIEKKTIEDLPALNVTLNTKTAPVFIKNYFDIPGLRINFVEWNINNSSWTFNMKIYLLPANYKREGSEDA
jgi:hypothetical protein